MGRRSLLRAVAGSEGCMRILFVNYEYPPLGGGGGTALSDIAEELATRHEIMVLTSGTRSLPAREMVGGVQVARISVPGRGMRAVASIASMAGFIWAGRRDGPRVALDFAPDVINTWFALPSGPVGAAISHALDRPNLLTIIGGDVYDPSKLTSPHRWPVTRAVVRGAGMGRYLLCRSGEAGLDVASLTLHRAEMAFPNTNLMWDLPMVDGYTPMRLKHYARARTVANIPDDLRAAALFGCRWVIERQPVAGGQTKVVRRENPEYRGLAWLTSQTATETEFEAVLRGEEVAGDPFETAYLPDGARLGLPRSPGHSGGAARVVSQDTRGVVAECEARAPGLLVLAYTWVPWLEARVNDKPAPLHRCNIAFCAVEVPEGASRVELRYHPPRLWEGLCVTLLSALMLGLLLSRAGRRSGR